MAAELVTENEYKDKIFSYISVGDGTKVDVAANFLSRQPQISPHTQAVVINWLVQVSIDSFRDDSYPLGVIRLQAQIKPESEAPTVSVHFVSRV